MNKVVLFDWGGVIESHYDKTNGWYTLVDNIINRMSNGKNNTIKRWATYTVKGQKRTLNTINTFEEIDEWYKYIAKKNKFELSKEEFFDIYDEEFSKILFYKDVVEYIHSLKGRCIVGILSNLSKIDKDRLNKQVDFNYIDKLFLSFELGEIKPNQAIYEKVEDILNVEVKNILFIDDTEENILVAKNRGWNVLQATGDQLDLIKRTVEEFIN